MARLATSNFQEPELRAFLLPINAHDAPTIVIVKQLYGVAAVYEPFGSSALESFLIAKR
jgi:hypothetical protein